MKHDDFLVTTTVNGKSWPQVWDNEEPLEIDYPVHWAAEQREDGIFLKHLTNGNELAVDPSFLNGDQEINLPLGKGEDRQVSIAFKRVKRVTPAFITSAEAMRAVGPAERYVSAGIRENLISFKEVPEEVYYGEVEALKVFQFKRAHGRVNIIAKIAGIRFKPKNTESRTMVPGIIFTITEAEALEGAIIYGSYWWRLNKVPTPQMIDLDELEKELKSQDLVSLQALSRGIGITLLVVLALFRGTYYINQSRTEKVKPPVVTEVELKKPKLIARVEPPKATPAPVAKVVPTPAPIQKKPEPRIAKKEPVKTPIKKIEPRKVAKKEPPKPVKEPPKIVKAPSRPKPVAAIPVAPAPARKPNPVVAKAPDPSAVANQQKASLAKSLNFLSTGPSKSVAALGNIPSAKFNAKYANTGNGGLPASAAALNNLAKENGGDGPISTRGERTVASNSGITGGHGKGLNEVQGKVAMNSLYGNGSGSDLGAAAGGGGITVSGPGKISDADIEKTLSKNLEKFQRCYEKALLTDSTLSGEVQIKWTIEMNGGVAGPAIVRSEMNQKDLHKCLIGVLSKINFPAPKGGTVTVKRPFRFKSSSF